MRRTDSRTSSGLRARPDVVVTLGVLALALVACFPTVTIEPLDGPAVAVRPQSSGVFLFVEVPSPPTGGALEVVQEDGTMFRIPPGHFPPPGECRVWDPDLPPGQQSPPGSCDLLERRVPAGHYLVYG